jgi:adenosylmethionine-8-amino-7-oxononanoate aminotransferase
MSSYLNDTPMVEPFITLRHARCTALIPPFILKPEEVEFLFSVFGEAADTAMKVN